MAGNPAHSVHLEAMISNGRRAPGRGLQTAGRMDGTAVDLSLPPQLWVSMDENRSQSDRPISEACPRVRVPLARDLCTAQSKLPSPDLGTTRTAG